MTRPKPITDQSSPLLDWRPESPIARGSDPATSHASARAMTAGARATHCEEIRALIAAHPGWIVPQLEKLYPGCGKHDFTKRVSDLVNAGRVKYSGTAVNEATGRRCGMVWAC